MAAKAGLAVVVVMLALAGAAQADTGPALKVDASADRHAISPEIYGLNFADATLAAQIGLPVDRWGGDDFETYNYTLGSRDSGAGNFFENLADCFDKCTGAPYTPAYQTFVSADKSRGTRSLMELPIMGWIAKDAPQDHPATCGFPMNVYPAQEAFDQFDPNCGNGISTSHNELRNTTPTRGGQAIDSTYAAQFAADLKSRGVDLYEPGNEPALWGSTHRDLHGNPETNSELITKFTDAAAAVKAQQPAAQIVGPSEWGWIGYFCDQVSFSGNGGLCNPPQGGQDATDTPAVVSFLDSMRTYQEQHGVRLLDYFDLHYYPQADALSTDRTRSLWDPTYTDPSYIDSVIRLIPRMHEWVDQHYPGTKLAITEYNFDLKNADPTLGALLEADALGIFARERVDLATMFDGPDATSPVADAFRLYRNYNGAGGRFGSTYVRSTSEDQGRVAVYGSLRGSDGALTVAVVNKAPTTQTSRLSLAAFTPGGPAQVWQSTGSGIARKPDAAVSGGALTVGLPARSMTLFVIPSASGSGGGGNNPGGGGRKLKVLKGTAHKDGSVTLKVNVPGAGKLSATATSGKKGKHERVVARGHRSAKKAGKVTLRVKPTKSGRRYIRAHRKGVRAKIKLTFRPKKGKALRTSTKARLRIGRR
jgi:hypothetical protein